MNKRSLANLKLGPSAGGRAVKDKVAPDRCPKCNRKMGDRLWHAYLGHLSLHRYAENRGLTWKEGAADFISKGLIAVDPAPYNGSWREPRFYPVDEGGQEDE